jgi:hypothetical protein
VSDHYRYEIVRDSAGEPTQLVVCGVTTPDAQSVAQRGEERVPGPSCARPGCPNSSRNGPGRRAHGKYCSDACRAAGWKQGRIEFVPPVEPLVPVATPKQIKDAHKAQTRKVLDMLLRGPQTTHNFLAAYVGRFGARIAELRAVGWPIEMMKLGEHGSHDATYLVAGVRDLSRGSCEAQDCEVCR